MVRRAWPQQASPCLYLWSGRQRARSGGMPLADLAGAEASVGVASLARARGCARRGAARRGAARRASLRNDPAGSRVQHPSPKAVLTARENICCSSSAASLVCRGLGGAGRRRGSRAAPVREVDTGCAGASAEGKARLTRICVRVDCVGLRPEAGGGGGGGGVNASKRAHPRAQAGRGRGAVDGLDYSPLHCVERGELYVRTRSSTSAT